MTDFFWPGALAGLVAVGVDPHHQLGVSDAVAEFWCENVRRLAANEPLSGVVTGRLATEKRETQGRHVYAACKNLYAALFNPGLLRSNFKLRPRLAAVGRSEAV